MISITLYLLGFYMNYRLGHKILGYRAAKYRTIEKLIGSAIWPASAVYYLLSDVFFPKPKA